MSRAVILSGVRTPVGRYGGVLSGARPDDLAALVIREVVDRAGVDAAEIEDVYFGCANQAGEDNRNVARMALLLAGLPESVPGVTVNRLCASGLSAIVSACHAIAAGEGELFVAGGVESMSRAPFVFGKPERGFPREVTVYDTTLGWRFPNPRLEAMFPLESMGETGENVAERYEVSREDQDSFGLQSQQLPHRGNRSDPHHPRIVPRDGARHEPAERRGAELLRALLARDDQCRGAVVDPAGVARGDGALLLECRLERGELLSSGVGTRVLVGLEIPGRHQLVGEAPRRRRRRVALL